MHVFKVTKRLGTHPVLLAGDVWETQTITTKVGHKGVPLWWDNMECSASKEEAMRALDEAIMQYKSGLAKRIAEADAYLEGMKVLLSNDEEAPKCSP